MARWRRSRLRWAVAGLLVVALVAAVIVAWPLVQRYTGAAPPAQFYEKVELDPALTRDTGPGSRHAGNNLGTLAAALRYGADVVEIDVISARPAGGGRDHWPLAGRAGSWPRGQADRSIVKLDLQRTDRGLLDDLVAFLEPRAGSRRVMISSRDPGALLYLHRPFVGDAVHQLQSDAALQEAIGGVSVFQGLVDANLVTWVHRHKLQILAWTVNDSQRLNQLVRLHVNGITTANLAILRALG